MEAVNPLEYWTRRAKRAEAILGHQVPDCLANHMRRRAERAEARLGYVPHDAGCPAAGVQAHSVRCTCGALMPIGSE